MNQFTLLRIYFKGELRAQGVYTTSPVGLGLNVFFYIMFGLFSFNMGRTISDYYNADPSSYESIVYTGSVMTIFTLILVYNALSIKELFGSYTTEEHHFLFMKGLHSYKQDFLLFGVSAFRALIVGIVIGSPMFIAFLIEGIFTFKSLASILLFLIFLSSVGYFINKFFPSIKVTSLFPALIILYLVCFMAITFVSYQLTAVAAAFTVVQGLFTFIKGDYSFIIYLIVFILTFLISMFSIYASDLKQRVVHIPFQTKWLKKAIADNRPRPVILLLLYIQSLNPLLIFTTICINLLFLLIVQLQNQYLNGVPTISILSMYFLYLMVISEINNKLKNKSVTYLDVLPIPYTMKISTKFLYLALLIFPVPLAGLLIMNSYEVIPLYLSNFFIVYLALEFTGLYKEKIHQLAALILVSMMLFGLFIVSSILSGSLMVTFTLYITGALASLFLLLYLKIRTSML